MIQDLHTVIQSTKNLFWLTNNWLLNFYAKNLKTRQTGNWSVLHDYPIVNIIVWLKVIRRLSNWFLNSLIMKLSGTRSNPTGSINSFSIKGTPCRWTQNNNKLRSKVFCWLFLTILYLNFEIKSYYSKILSRINRWLLLLSVSG